MKMRPGLKFKLKKLISVLVCVMMVAATFPFHVLNSAVFADEDGAVIHISQNNLSAGLEKIINSNENKINIVLDENIEILPDFSGMSDESFFDFKDNEKFAQKTIKITSNKNKQNSPFELKNKSEKMSLLAAKGCSVVLENIIFDGENVEGSKNFIDLSFDATLALKEGAVVQNVKRAGESSAIALNYSSKLEIAGGSICGFSGVKGSAINANNGSSVNMYKNSHITRCTTGGSGGAISVVSDSHLNLMGGHISECSSGLLGDAVFFESCGEYEVALPNGDLKISIPKSLDNSHNSDARVVGYVGIYKSGIDRKVSDDKQYLYYEAEIDADGGIYDDGFEPGKLLLISRKADDGQETVDKPLLNYLPKDLKRDEVFVSGWTYAGDAEKQIENKTKIGDIFINFNVCVKLTPKYEIKSAEVSNPSELEHALANLGDNCKITLKSDMQIDDTICVGGNKNVVIESPEGETHTLTVDSRQTFLTTTSNSNVTLKNIHLNGGCAEDFDLKGGSPSLRSFVDVTSNSKLEIVDCDFNNYEMTGDRRVVSVANGTLGLRNCRFEECRVRNEGDAFGGVLEASGQSNVTLDGCIIKNCYAWSVDGRARGGAIYWDCSVSNDAPAGSTATLKISGGQITGCYAYSKSGKEALGDCIYLGKGGQFTDNLEFDPSYPTKISIDKSRGSARHNSWIGYVGYVGIYKEGIPVEKESDSGKEELLKTNTGVATDNSVLEIDCDGAVDLDGDLSNEMLCIPSSANEAQIIDYLPTTLQKDGALVSGWKYGSDGNWTDITAETTVQTVLDAIGSGAKIVAEYAEPETVQIDGTKDGKSPYKQLQEAIYNAKGTCIIELSESINIGDNIGDWPLIEGRTDITEFNASNVQKNVCFCDNKTISAKEIIIRGKEGEDVSITLKDNAKGLFYLQNGILTFENITLSYANSDGCKGPCIFMDKNSILNLNKGAKIENFVGSAYSAIYLDKATANINPGSEISNCSRSASEGELDGGAICALDGSTVNIGGSIKKCQLKGKDVGLAGGAIYAKKSSVNLMDGCLIEKCYCSNEGGTDATKSLNGGAVFAEESKVHMSGGLISGCYCWSTISQKMSGGAISLGGGDSTGSFIMTGGSIESCWCSYTGSVPDSDAIEEGVLICGGGIACQGSNNLFLKAGKIVGCYIRANSENVDNYVDTSGLRALRGDAVFVSQFGSDVQCSIAPSGADLIIGIDENANQNLHNIDVKYDGYPGIYREVTSDDIKFHAIAIGAEGAECFDGRDCDANLTIQIKDSSGAQTSTKPIYTYLPTDLKKGDVWVSGWRYKDKDGNFVDITKQTTVGEVLGVEEPEIKAVFYSPDQKVNSPEEFLDSISSRPTGEGDITNTVCVYEDLDLSAVEGLPINVNYGETLIIEGKGDKPRVIWINPNSPFLNIISGKVILKNVIIKGLNALDGEKGDGEEAKDGEGKGQGGGMSATIYHEDVFGGAVDDVPITLSDGAILETQEQAGFEDLKATDHSIVTASNKSKVFLNGGLIKDCECESRQKNMKGGFIRLKKDSILKIIGTKIENCSCSSIKSAYGGFAYSTKNSSIFIKDCDIKNCYCRSDIKGGETGKAYGGVIYSNNSKINIVSGIISGCEVSTYSHQKPDLRGDVIYFKGNADDCRICAPNDVLKITVPLHDNSHNSDAKIWGYWGIYVHGVLAKKSNSSDFKYYEIPIDSAESVDRDHDKNANSVYVDKNSLDEPVLKYLPTDDRVRKWDGAVISGWETEKGIKIEETTKVRDILQPNSIQTKKLKPIYSKNKFRVSRYLQLQKAMYEASGNVTINLDCDIEILDNDDYPLMPQKSLNCCFADDASKGKNIVIESTDASHPKKITNKKENARLFVFQTGSLTFRNIILDGGAVYKRAPSDKIDYGFGVDEGCTMGMADFMLISSAKLNLDSGAVIQNVYLISNDVHVLNAEYRAEINLNDGSRIADCCVDVDEGGVQGCAVASFGSTVNMNGGLIIGCVIDTQKNMEEEAFAYGAAMYLDGLSSLNLKKGNILRCGVKCYDDDSAKGDAIYFASPNPEKYNVVGPNQGLKIEISFFKNEPHNTSAHIVGYRGIFIKHGNTHVNKYYELRLRCQDLEAFLDKLDNIFGPSSGSGSGYGYGYGYGYGSGYGYGYGYGSGYGYEYGSGSEYIFDYTPVAYVYVETGKISDFVKKYLPNAIGSDGEPIVSWYYDISDENPDGTLVGDKTTLKTVLKEELYADLWFDCYAQKEHVNSYKQLQKAIYEAKSKKTIILDNDIMFGESEEYPDAIDVIEKYGTDQAYPNAEPGCCFSDDIDIRQKITIKSAEGKICKIQDKKPGSVLFAIRNGVLKLKNIIIDGGAIYDENGKAAPLCSRRMANFINISNKSLLVINQGATIQNVYRNCRDCHAIYLQDEGGVRINGGLITRCKNVNASCDYNNYGGAICATDRSSVKMNSGSITDCAVINKNNSCGGAIYIGPNAKLVLKEGIISGCLSSFRGDAIYFAGVDPKDYDVVLPGKGLTITIPLTDAKNSRNSDARIVGYQGIFKAGLGDRSATKKDFLYYELNVDLNGGSSAGCVPSLTAIYISKDAVKNADDVYVSKYLPTDLTKDGVSLTGWECDCVEVVKNATIFSFLENENSTSTKILKARYDKGEEHVSNYRELQHAIYHAQGTKTIFLDCNIDINCDIDETGGCIYKDAADATDSQGKSLYPNAQKGYCLSDNNFQTNRKITIKSSGDNVFKITNQKKTSGLLAVRGGIIRFENVIIDGADCAKNVSFINASKYSEIEFGQGATVQNVKASGKACVICLNESVLILGDNSFITNCSGAVAGAVYAAKASEVILKGGEIKNCSSGKNGGAICVLNSKLNLERGRILACSAKEKGDAIYFDGDDSGYNVAKPGKGLEIRILPKDNSHNSYASVLGYWGIYKKGLKERAKKYYEIEVVDADSGQHIDYIYIDLNDLKSKEGDIKIMPYLQETLAYESGQSVKWVYHDGIDEKEITPETQLAVKRGCGSITVIIKKVKAIKVKAINE